MKRFVTFPFIMMMMFSIALPMTIMADNAPSQTIPLKKKPKKDHNQELNFIGNRMPSRPIFCTISEDGIQSGINPDEIILFEIWDPMNDVCQVSYTEEVDFIQHLFQQPGEYQIMLITDNYYFVGYISTL